MLRNLVRIKAIRSIFGGSSTQLCIKQNSFCTFSNKEEPLATNSGNIASVANKSDISNSSAILSENFTIAAKDTAYVESEEGKAKRLKVLQLEADILHQEGGRVPRLDYFKDNHWDYVLTLSSKSARMKYYAYLWGIEMKKLNRERKQIEKAEQSVERQMQVRKERQENDHIIYGLGHTTMFLRIYETTMNLVLNNKLSRAMQFGLKLVLDCSYDRYMTRREAINASKQLMLCFAENRFHDDPFDLHFCNVDMESPCMQSLKRYIPTMLNPEFPLHVHNECFTKIFPKERLVYLTPHCRTDLVEYNPDDIYIVGAMVDTVNNEPLSLAKAKRLGIRMARLPLDRYLQWSAGSGKSLTLNHMTNIMLDIKSTGDWQRALRHVPRRKIADPITDTPRDRHRVTVRAGKLNVRIDQLLDNEMQSESKSGSVHVNPFNNRRRNY